MNIFARGGAEFCPGHFVSEAFHEEKFEDNLSLDTVDLMPEPSFRE
jgi:hypothetical protein